VNSLEAEEEADTEDGAESCIRGGTNSATSASGSHTTRQVEAESVGDVGVIILKVIFIR
jgi:hypothetical protein